MLSADAHPEQDAPRGASGGEYMSKKPYDVSSYYCRGVLLVNRAKSLEIGCVY
jgi:hypothetical protein